MITSPRIPWEHDALMAAVIPVDECFRKAEVKWGVARLERLVSTKTLESFRRGWTMWREAIETNDLAAIQRIASGMVKILGIMDREATEAGEPPLAVETWEHILDDGRVLVVVKTTAEASAIAAAAKLGTDGMLPPDLALLVRHQHAGRELVVWTMGELARVLPGLGVVDEIKRTWPGATVVRGPITGENDAVDWVSNDPVRAAIEQRPERPISNRVAAA